MAGRLRRKLKVIGPMAGLVALCAPAIAEADKSYAPAESEAKELALADCEQRDSSPLVVRACTAMLQKSGLEPTERARILVMRGVAWIMEEEFEAAVEDFSGAIKIDATLVTALEGRARAYTKLADHGHAAADWSRLIALQPNNDLYYRNRGANLLGAKQHQDAISDYDTSLELNPMEVEGYIGRAAVFDAIGDRAQAEQEYTKGIAVNPNYLMLYWQRANMAERWGEQKMAIKDYEMVLKINGHFAHARKALIRLGIMHPP